MNRDSRLRLIVLLTMLMVMLLTLSGTASAAGPVGPTGGRPLFAVMTGTQEVPPGDPDGSGTATIWLNQGQSQVCWEIFVTNIALPATAAHIHVAPPGVPGPVVVPLTPPDATGRSSGCTTASAELIKAIRQNPENYYVNVHNAQHPAGAVRGQLSKH